MTSANRLTSPAIAISILFLISIALLSISNSPLASPGIVIFASIICIITLINTDVALIILIFAMLLSPDFKIGNVPGRDVVIRADDIILLVIFFGWLIKMAVNKDLGLLKKTPINKPILLYVFICLVSSGLGALSGTTNIRYSFFYILKYIEYFLVFFMVHNHIRETKQVKRFIFFILLTCVIVSIYALYSTIVLGIRASAPFEGTFGEANTLAGYLILMIGITLGITLHTRSVRLLVLLSGLLVFIFTPFIYTLSRSGWLGFIAMYIACLIFSRRNKLALIFLLIFIAVVSPVLIPEVAQDRFEATFIGRTSINILGSEITLDESAMARLHSFTRSIKLWSDNPVFGNGVPGGGVVSDVQYTRVLREVGIIGFLIFMWIIYALYKAGLKSYSHPGADDFARGLSLGFLSALTGILVMGVGAEVFIIIRIMEPFWFLAAIVVSLPGLSIPETAAAEPVSSFAYS